MVALSSNYELYGSISARPVELLGRYSAWLEVHSIDEAFLGVKGEADELLELGRTMKGRMPAARRRASLRRDRTDEDARETVQQVGENNPAFNGVCRRESVPGRTARSAVGQAVRDRKSGAWPPD